MQLLASALFITAAAATANSNLFNLNSTCDENKPRARVINRCSYPVYLWSVVTGQACPAGQGAVLQPGQFYQENFRPAVPDSKGNKIGASIKISKNMNDCTQYVTQLEYLLNESGDVTGHPNNWIDISYVNCKNDNFDKCPTRSDGLYLKSGNDGSQALKASADNSVCPILSCHDTASCKELAYNVYNDDLATHNCPAHGNLDFYMCGGEAPGNAPVAAPSNAAPSKAPSKAPSSQAPPSQAPPSKAYTPAPAPSSKAAYTPSAAQVQAAAVTSAPKQEHTPAIKTEVVYVTQYQNAKRHAHGHRHQHFRA